MKTQMFGPYRMRVEGTVPLKDIRIGDLVVVDTSQIYDRYTRTSLSWANGMMAVVTYVWERYYNGPAIQISVINTLKEKPAVHYGVTIPEQGNKTIELVRLVPRASLMRDTAPMMIQNLGNGEGSFTIGSDPEFFLANAKGEHVPAFEVLPSKDRAITVGGRGGTCFNDGFAAEVTINPNSCCGYLGDTLHSALTTLAAQAKKHHLTISGHDCFEVPYEVLQAADADNVRLGCAPSLNAYGRPHKLFGDGRGVPLRFAGCHLHFGVKTPFDTLNNRTPRHVSNDTIVKDLDRVFGVLLTALFAGYEDPRRRAFYGCAGEYRTPAHGLEYRVPSMRLAAHPGLFHMGFDIARQVINWSRVGVVKVLWKGTPEAAEEIINNYDIVGARRMLEKNKTTVAKLFKPFVTASRWLNTSPATEYSKIRANHFAVIWQAIMEDLRVLVPEPYNVADNWLLNSEWTGHSDGQNCHFRSLASNAYERATGERPKRAAVGEW